VWNLISTYATLICPEGAKYRSPGFTITTNPRPSVPSFQREERSRGRNRVRPDFVLGHAPSVGQDLSPRTIALLLANPGRRQPSLRCGWLCPGLWFFPLQGRTSCLRCFLIHLFEPLKFLKNFRSKQASHLFCFPPMPWSMFP